MDYSSGENQNESNAMRFKKPKNIDNTEGRTFEFDTIQVTDDNVTYVEHVDLNHTFLNI